MTAPIDRLKMLLQIHDGKQKMTIKEGVRKMAAEGSVKSFFKGNGTNVVKIAPETAIKLTMNDVYKRWLVEDPDEITPPQRMAAGALAGATAQSIIYPLELVRTRLAVCPTGTYAGIADTARKVLAQEGWRAFYRGMLPSMLGILPYAGVDITTFELLKEHLLEEYDGRPPAHMILGAGMLSSSVAQFSAYPLALVRTRLQAQGIGGRPVKYDGMVDVLVKTYRNEGFRGLYKVGVSLGSCALLAPGGARCRLSAHPARCAPRCCLALSAGLVDQPGQARARGGHQLVHVRGDQDLSGCGREETLALEMGRAAVQPRPAARIEAGLSAV